jgi:subtilisin family serine protease
MRSVVAQVAAAAVMSATPATPVTDPGRIVVKLRPDAQPGAVGILALTAGVELERALPQIRVYVMRAPAGRADAAVATLRQSPVVEVAQREIVLSALGVAPNDFSWPEQWGLRRTGFPQVWEVPRGSPRTIVAVVDTGVEASHPDLAGNVLRGFDFVNHDTNASDDNGHGTAVAGVVAARANNEIGIAGACWTCTVLPVKVLDQGGTGLTSDVAAGIIWAADRGARVINLSLGGFGTTVALTDALAYAADRDIVLVGAAGNDGSSARFHPAADDNVIGVAATDPLDRLYPWSNRGAWVDVAAPGCNPTLWPRSGYAGFCGTSSASPVVAGLAAMIRSSKPKASAEEVARQVRQSALPGPSGVEYGRIDAARALPPSRAQRRRLPAGSVGLAKSRLIARLRHPSSSPPKHSGPGHVSSTSQRPASVTPSPRRRPPRRVGVLLPTKKWRS